MFTGLIRDRGSVESAQRHGDAARLRLSTKLASGLALGDSLAVNGVCLTVETITGNSVVAAAVEETMDRTTLGSLRRGQLVNLEPALRAGDAMGGHIVQGHVDGVATLRVAHKRGLSHELTVDAPGDLLRYVVAKGSVALDGVSLTVARVEADGFVVAVIPHSWAETVLELRQPGDRINVEVDILAKYVERMLGLAGVPAEQLTLERLRQLGY